MLLAITPPNATPKVVQYYNALLGAGLSMLLLRLPDASQEQYEDCIRAIEPRHRSKVILADYFHLVPVAGLGGIHLKASRQKEWKHWQEVAQAQRVMVSAHSLDELESLPFCPDLALLSPVFDSISKGGYHANIDLDECRSRLPKLPFPVLALGGITPDNYPLVCSYGFAGGATLGYLAEQEDAMEEAFLRFARPEVLTLAGHDPSSGAGLTADVRTIERLGAYPLSITTALTIQDEFEFVACQSVDFIPALRQLLKRHKPHAAKIGLVASLQDVYTIADMLQEAGVRQIVWDPILQPSYGRDPLHADWTPDLLHKIFSCCSLITPNLPEAERLFGTDWEHKLQQVADTFHVAILLKGGHSANRDSSCDVLYQPHREAQSSRVPRTPFDKHGTGCALSAAIATALAQGETLSEACRKGQWYVDALRRSGKTRLAILPPSGERLKAEKLRRGKLQFITDSPDLEEILNQCRAALQGGVRWIQLRMKTASTEERVIAAGAICQEMQPYPSAILIIDDDVEAALRSDADGVHVGLDDLPPADVRHILGTDKIVGATCNRIEDLALRSLQGVDYVGIGPFRTTQTKKLLSPLLGEEGMAALVRFNHTLPQPIPLIAIGGITAGDFSTLAGVGVQGIALSGIINHATDPQAESSRLVQLSDQYF